MKSLEELMEEHRALLGRYQALCIRQRSGERVGREVREATAALDVAAAVLEAAPRRRTEEHLVRDERLRTAESPLAE